MSRLPKFDRLNYVLFLTAATYKRISFYTMDERFRAIFFDNLQFYRRKYDFKLYGFCLLPDHFHLLGFLPEDRRLSDFLRGFKGFMAKQILDVLKQEKSPLLKELWIGKKGRKKDSVYRVFQEDTFVHNIFSEEKLEEKLNYIHNNPVEAGLVKEEKDWPYSSWHNYYRDDQSLIKIDLPFESFER